MLKHVGQRISLLKILQKQTVLVGLLSHQPLVIKYGDQMLRGVVNYCRRVDESRHFVRLGTRRSQDKISSKLAGLRELKRANPATRFYAWYNQFISSLFVYFSFLFICLQLQRHHYCFVPSGTPSIIHSNSTNVSLLHRFMMMIHSLFNNMLGS